MVLVCHVTSQDTSSKRHGTLWVEALKVCHHPPKFCGHSDCGRGDIMILVCQVIFRDHVIKVSGDFMGRSPSQ